MIPPRLKHLKKKLLSQLFCIAGMRPWSLGYSEYKQAEIVKALNRKSFEPRNLPDGYGFRIDERIVEYAWLFDRLPADRAGTILDAGSTLNFEYILNNPKLSNKKMFISTLAPEAACYWNKGISYVYEDLRRSHLRDECFDWIASISTIEHVGLDNTMLYTSDSRKNENQSRAYLSVIKEYSRMLKSGGTLFLTFPYGKHKNHGWFQVFDGQMVDEIVDVFAPEKYLEYYYQYKELGWVSASRKQCNDATYFDINKTKKLDPDYAAASRAIICIELTK